MSALPENLSSKRGTGAQLSLEKARLDLLNIRAQMSLGFILVAILSVVDFFSFFANGSNSENLRLMGWLSSVIKHTSFLNGTFFSALSSSPYPPVTTITLLLEWFVWQDHCFAYLVTNLVVSLLCTLFVGLIGLEVTGRAGNRLGAVPAIWACLLFSLYPFQARLTGTLIAAREYQLNCLFALLAIYAGSRLLLLKEKAPLLLCVISVLLLAVNGLPGEFEFLKPDHLAVISATCREIFFPFLPPVQEKFLYGALVASYSSLIALFVARVSFKMARLKSVFVCIVCLASLLVFFSRPGDLVNAARFYAAIPLSYLLTFLALPPEDSAKLSPSRAYSLIGLVILSVIVAIWSSLLRNAI